MSKVKIKKIDVFQINKDFWRRCALYATLDTNWRSVEAVERNEIKRIAETADNLRADIVRYKKAGDDNGLENAAKMYADTIMRLEERKETFTALQANHASFPFSEADERFAAAYMDAFDMSANMFMPFDYGRMQKAFEEFSKANGIPYKAGSDLECYVLKAVGGTNLASTRVRVRSNNKTWLTANTKRQFMAKVYNACVEYALNKGMHLVTGQFPRQVKAMFAPKKRG